MSRSITLKTHRAFFILVAFAAVLFLSDIGAYKEFVRAESYFALGSQSMVERGEWLTPHAPDELQLNKPPLTYWLIGISYKLLGAGYGTARLPSVLAAIAVLWIVYLLGVRLQGIRAGLISAAILATSYLFLSFARMAMSDMLLTLWVTAAIGCFLVVASAQTNRWRGFALMAYIALALGVLTKGPIALVLVTIPVGLELAMSRDRAGFKRLRVIPGVCLLLLITGLYFLLVYARMGAEPLKFFFLSENLQRFTGQIYAGGARPFWYEPAALFSDFAPWSPLLFLAAWFDWRRPDRDENDRRPRRLLYLWLGWTVLLFSLANFKRDYYLLPAMPAAALIIGPLIANTERLTTAARRILSGLLVLVSVGILAAALLSLRAAVVISVQTPARFFSVAIALIGIGLVVSQLARQRIWQASLILMMAMWATIISMQLSLFPAFSRYLPATQLAAKIPASRVVYSSWAASDWANCIAFNLPAPHTVERLIGDADNQKLVGALKIDPRAVAIIWEREYARLVAQDSGLVIIAQAETFGHGGLNLEMVRHPSRQRLLLVGHRG